MTPLNFKDFASTLTETSRSVIPKLLTESETAVNFLKRQQQYATILKPLAQKVMSSRWMLDGDIQFSDKLKQALANFYVKETLRLRPDSLKSPRYENLENDLNRFFDPANDYLIEKRNDQQLASRLNDTQYTIEKLNADAEEWHEELAQRERGKGPSGRPILKLDSIGWKGWSWNSLDAAYCKSHGDALGHCGNAGWRNGDNILSLFDPEGYPHLTFIVNNKVLGESKGRANAKPSAKYHPAIIELLKSEYIETIRGGGYKPENNFKLSDLPKQQQDELTRLKPTLDHTKWLLEKGDTKSLSEAFNQSILRVEDKRIVWRNLGDELGKELNEELKSFSGEGHSYHRDHGPVESFYYYTDNETLFNNWSGTSHDWSDVSYHVKHIKNDKKLMETLRERWDELEEPDGEFSVENLYEQDEEFKDVVDRAMDDAEISGTEGEAYKSVVRQLENVGGLFHVTWSDTDSGYILWSDKAKAIAELQQIDQGDIDNDSILTLKWDISVSIPRYGFSGFDEERFVESIKDQL